MIVMAGYDGGDNQIYVSGENEYPAGTVYVKVTYPNGPALGLVSPGSVFSVPVETEHETNPMEFTVHALDSQQESLGFREFRCLH